MDIAILIVVFFHGHFSYIAPVLATRKSRYIKNILNQAKKGKNPSRNSWLAPRIGSLRSEVVEFQLLSIDVHDAQVFLPIRTPYHPNSDKTRLPIFPKWGEPLPDILLRCCTSAHLCALTVQ